MNIHRRAANEFENFVSPLGGKSDGGFGNEITKTPNELNI
jgi:hypothetical protein